jgi:hypothetical protein
MLVIEIFKFMIPNDLFQFFFLGIILLIGFWNYFSIKKNANPQNWLAKWENETSGDDNDDLDSEHGSVLDISQAVSTNSEKWAEMIPGIMLILGLLGTFLGLGVALNKASYILSNAHSTNFSDLIENLINMMEGLGTKFKTSAWGIMGFLIFKSWISINGFEERRLRWAISKMKQETIKRRNELQQFENNNYAKMQDLLQEMIKHVVEQRKFYQNLESSVKQMSDNTKKMEKNTFKMQQDYSAFIESTAQNIEEIQVASTSLSNSADRFTIASNNFSATVQEFSNTIKDEIKQTLDYFAENMSGHTRNLGNSIERAITEFHNYSQNFTQNIEELNELINNLNNKITNQNDINKSFTEQILEQLKTLKTFFEDIGKHFSEEISNIKNDLIYSLNNLTDRITNLNADVNNISVSSNNRIDTLTETFKEEVYILNDNFSKLFNVCYERVYDTIKSTIIDLTNLLNTNATNIINEINNQNSNLYLQEQNILLTEIKNSLSEDINDLKKIIELFESEQKNTREELREVFEKFTFSINTLLKRKDER